MRPFFGYQRFSPYQVENLDLAYVLRTHVLRTQYQKIPKKKSLAAASWNPLSNGLIASSIHLILFFRSIVSGLWPNEFSDELLITTPKFSCLPKEKG